ncbi:hypothetical protein [Bacillus subtilis]|uniref:hypothetical protein n=1 Tax=Bacillus subtilis TaxID=1423 RepID=UPI003CEBC7FB
MSGCLSNVFNFCGSRNKYERQTQVFALRFHRDHHFALELFFRSASQMGNAMIADHEGQIDAAITYYDAGTELFKRLVEQWEIVMTNNDTFKTYITGKLREEFVRIATSINIKSLMSSSETTKTYTLNYNGAYELVEKILSAGGETAITELFKECKNQYQNIYEMSQEMVKLLESNRQLIAEGKFYDTIINYSHLVKKKKHPIMELDEKLFTALTFNQLYLETISMLTREVAIKSNIPYEECSFKFNN